MSILNSVSDKALAEAFLILIKDLNTILSKDLANQPEVKLRQDISHAISSALNTAI